MNDFSIGKCGQESNFRQNQSNFVSSPLFREKTSLQSPNFKSSPDIYANPDEEAKRKQEKKVKRHLMIAYIVQALVIGLCIKAFLHTPKKTSNELKELVSIEKAIDNAKNDKYITKKGLWLNKISKDSKELINNAIYGFGTLIIMPLVVLFSPIGSKKSSKEDKVFTAWRQPLSFITMFSFQLMTAKYLATLVPKMAKAGLLGKDYMVKGFDELYKNMPKEKIENLKKETEAKIQLLSEVFGIATNIVTVPISCTLLNVFYGAFMKKMKNRQTSANSQQIAQPTVNGGAK